MRWCYAMSAGNKPGRNWVRHKSITKMQRMSCILWTVCLWSTPSNIKTGITKRISSMNVLPSPLSTLTMESKDRASSNSNRNFCSTWWPMTMRKITMRGISRHGCQGNSIVCKKLSSRLNPCSFYPIQSRQIQACTVRVFGRTVTPAGPLDSTSLLICLCRKEFNSLIRMLKKFMVSSWRILTANAGGTIWLGC